MDEIDRKGIEMESTHSTDNLREALTFQLNMAWQLFEMHLTNLEEEECYWKPRTNGIYVEKINENWSIAWPEKEDYEIGPPNIAWTLWHMTYWWRMAIDYNIGDGKLTKEEVQWPGNIEKTKAEIKRCYEKWMEVLETLPDEEFTSRTRTKWPFTEKPFHDVAAWLNVELMKNASEIGYIRFLYATREK